MQFTDKHTYSKNSDTVMKMYSDRAFFERKYKEAGYWDIQVLEHEKQGDRFHIKCQYSMKASAPIPAFARKFLPETQTVVQSDTWDCKAKKGHLQFEVKGLPFKINCDMALVDEKDGAANNFKWDVTIRIPLVGGKIEEIVATDIRNKSKHDLTVSRKILEDY